MVKMMTDSQRNAEGEKKRRKERETGWDDAHKGQEGAAQTKEATDNRTLKRRQS